MPETPDWRVPDVARSALSNPATSPMELLAICLAQPALRAEAAMHPSADSAVLAWIAGQDDPVAAATAQARLFTMQGVSQPWAPVQAAAPAESHAGVTTAAPSMGRPPEAARQVAVTSRRHRNSLVIGLSAAGVLLVALVVVAVTVLPTHGGGGGSYSYVADYRELPGIAAVNTQAGLPTRDDQTWTTSFIPMPSVGMVLATNSTSAFSTYQDELTAYSDAVAARHQWDSDYTSGYDQGKTCLTNTGQQDFYSSMAEYCENNSSTYLSVNSPAGYAGYVDAINSAPANPALPEGAPGHTYATPPDVPAEPTPPSTGDNLKGIDLATGSISWTTELSALWQGVQPQVWTLAADADKILVGLIDPSQNGDGDGDRMIAVLDARTGAVQASHLFDAAETYSASLHGDIVVLGDEDGEPRALKAADLETEVWTSPARLALSDMDSPFWTYSLSLDGYLLTDEGYLKISDGSRAPFARDAGQDGITVARVTNSKDQYVRIEPSGDSTVDLAGFDLAHDTETWQLRGVNGVPVWAGGLLVAQVDGDVAAYRVNGNQLQRQWRRACTTTCGISFADDSRVFVQDNDEGELFVLNTADGDEIESLRNSDGYEPVVGRSVLYLRDDSRVVAHDLTKTGMPTLWRSPDVAGWFGSYGDHLVLISNGESGSLLGIVGLDADDWKKFEPTEE